MSQLAGIGQTQECSGQFFFDGEMVSRGSIDTSPKKPKQKALYCGTCSEAISMKSSTCFKCQQVNVQTLSTMPHIVSKWRQGRITTDEHTEVKPASYNRHISFDRNFDIQHDTSDLSSVTSGMASINTIDSSNQIKRLLGIKKKAALQDDPEYAAALLVFNYKTEKRKQHQQHNSYSLDEKYHKFIGSGSSDHAMELLNCERRIINKSKKGIEFCEKANGGKAAAFYAIRTADGRPLYTSGFGQDRSHHVRMKTNTKLKIK